MYQLTRDSLTTDDEVLAPHVVAVPLDGDATLGQLSAWLRQEPYLPATPDDGSWLVHLSSREGAPVARVRRVSSGQVEVFHLEEEDLPLHGAGSIHLEHVGRDEDRAAPAHPSH